MKKARLAVIGCGGLAQGQHLPNMDKLDNAAISMICDVNRETLDQVGNLYGIARRSTDHREVLRDPATDGVLIVTKPASLASRQSGQPVMIE